MSGEVDVGVFGVFNAYHVAQELQTLGRLRTLYYSHPTRAPPAGIPSTRMRGEHLLREALRRTIRVDAHDTFAARFDRRLASRLRRRPPRAFHGWAGCALESMRAVHDAGGKAVLDRAGSHILWQREQMRIEADTTGVAFNAAYFRMTERMLEEYDVADAIVVPSTYALETMVRHGVPRTKLHPMVAGMAAPTNVVPPGARGVGFHVLYVGGVPSQKGLYYLLRAWSDAGLPPDARLTCVTGGYPPAWNAWTNAPGLTIRPLMPRTELFKLYNEAHVLCLPAADDAFGFVVEEAMHHGLPVVISRNQGGWDVVQDDRQGYVVPTRDVGALADALRRLYDSPEKRLAMAHSAMETAAKHCVPDRYREALGTLYGKLLA